MNEFFTSIKTLIEKVNLIVLLLSLAVAILVYKIWFPDLIWAGFVFCLAYPCITGINKIIVSIYKEQCVKIEIKKREENQNRKKEEEYNQRKAYLCTIFESLSPEEKRGLIMLYHFPMPEGGFCNARIIDPNSEIMQLIGHTLTMAHALHNGTTQLIWRDSVLNKIINIDLVFYDVLEEKSKTFEM